MKNLETNKRMMKKKQKHQDLQPWLTYFKVLQTYEEKGYLEVKPTDLEAYVTRAALCTLENKKELALPSGKDLADALMCIRAYTGWRSQKGQDVLQKPFALHVVREDMPHDLLCTVLVTRRRKWTRLWLYTDHVEVISYVH